MLRRDPIPPPNGIEPPVSGAAMDRPLPKQRPNYWLTSIGALVLGVGITVGVQWVPRGLRVAADDLRIATVHQGVFQNDVLVRATAAPLHTVMIDVFESGRVEEVLVRDGALVEKGQLLFRLSNPQRRLDLVAREADRAQQISNLSLLRVAIEASKTDHLRRMLDLNFAVTQTQKQYARYLSLVDEGFVSAGTLELSRDQLSQQRQALEEEQMRAAVEMRIKRDGAMKMEQAIERLDAGLRVVNESLDALTVRAPIAGRLTDFRLQLGEIVKPEQRIGRIDDPGHFRLVAQIDEYYLGSVSTGTSGRVSTSGREYIVNVSRVFPQIRDGRFSIEMLFANETPVGMSPGQSAETRLTLGEARPALVLPNDAFLDDSGGTWVFVVDADGRTAHRRAVSVGRRNNSQIEVASGLAPGERVIVSAYAAYGDAERLQITHSGS